MTTTNHETGIDCTGTWSPHQYALDAGWDATQVEATARLGVVADADAEVLSAEQAESLLAWCRERTAE